MTEGVELLPPHSHPEDQPHLDRQGKFQPIGNRCCTSWPRSFQMRSLRYALINAVTGDVELFDMAYGCSTSYDWRDKTWIGNG